ncbi:hypothetical protein DYB32_009676 [Aphanomyces invadans]|uniref:Uncharacterized protein n=1 Tax=Aphanomyces invadans TaxID=157072 RepID=A0A418AI87_9STRA|nr:hypothetical protein DYB32_009676 [Aphanomyces invadans]
MSTTTTHLKEEKSNSLVFAVANFNIYMVRIQAKIRSKGLRKVVSGEVTGEEADDYDSKEERAFDILVNSLDDDNLAYVSHVTTSKEVWDLHITPYEARMYADVSHIIHELHTKVYTPGSCMQKHITDLRGLQQKLLLMESRVDDEMLGRILQTSVKEVFPTTVEILRSREPSATLDQIINLVLSREDEVKSGTPYKKKQAVKDICHYCHKIGHYPFEWRYKKRDLAKAV